MAKYVLVGDSSLSAPFRRFPLLKFLPSAPTASVPAPIYKFLKGELYSALPSGETSVAPYSIRKIEAALLTRNRREDVVVAHEDHLNRFVNSDTEIIAVSTMDPFGLGPLTMSFMILLGGNKGTWVNKEWNSLIAKINAARRGKKAKLIVGGPGVWEFTIRPEELDKEGIDYAFQGESEDILCGLFEQISKGNIDNEMFYHGFQTRDENFHMKYVEHPKFLTRTSKIGTMVPLDKIPTIVNPADSGMVEIMRGCGIGCDFCEVTLRPLRYYPIDKILREVEVNVRAGFTNAWLHTDEIFGFRHTRPTFEPNEEALIELFTAVMSVKGVRSSNPTHARISPATAYPEFIKKLSEIMRAGPDNWIGAQVGVETGSDRLAKMHMPNKTLPLHIGPDGRWMDIVWQGTYNLNKYFWRPAFTTQCGQKDETEEDNWDTVALINRLSNSYVDGRPFEFTTTPMQNVPLGLIKSREFSDDVLTPAQSAVYYASYRHLYKIASRNAKVESRHAGSIGSRLGTSAVIPFGGWLMMKFIERIVKKNGVDIEKVKSYGLKHAAQRIETDRAEQVERITAR